MVKTRMQPQQPGLSFSDPSNLFRRSYQLPHLTGIRVIYCRLTFPFHHNLRTRNIPSHKSRYRHDIEFLKIDDVIALENPVTI